jgi:hypothetical protein
VFISGYVITNEGDTLHGLIKQAGSKHASLTCKFKLNEDSKATSYEPSEITGYRFTDGKYYISKEMPIYDKKKLVFAEFLIKGIANIFYVNYRNVDHYYIETEKDGIVELSEPERIAETDSGNFYLPPKYPGKLTYTLSDYNKINEEVAYLNLDHKSLIKLAKNYHEAVCDTGQCIIYEKKVQRVKTSFGLMAGYAMSSFNFGNRIVSDFGPGWTIGATLNLENIIVSNKRFYLQFDLSYSRHSGNTFTAGSNDIKRYVTYNDIRYYISETQNDTVYDGYIITTQLKTDLDLVYLKIPFTFNYSGLSKTLRPFFGVGFNTMFVLSQNKQFKEEVFVEAYGQSFPTFLFGFKARLGIIRPLGNQRGLYFEIDYDYLTNYNINSSIRLRMNSFQFVLGYRF